MVYMVKERSTDELIKELLEKRGYESRNQIEKFINPDYSDFGILLILKIWKLLSIK